MVSPQVVFSYLYFSYVFTYVFISSGLVRCETNTKEQDIKSKSGTGPETGQGIKGINCG